MGKDFWADYLRTLILKMLHWLLLLLAGRGISLPFWPW